MRPIPTLRKWTHRAFALPNLPVVILHIYNPDTEMALAADSVNYTPPRAVASFIRRECLLPALYAKPAEAILLPPGLHHSDTENLPYADYVRKKKLNLVESGQNLSTYIPKPWGWNKSISRYLNASGVPSDALPSEKNLTDIRRTTSKRFAAELLPLFPTSSLRCHPVYLDSEQSVANFFTTSSYPQGWVVKHLWASSGRGVAFFSPTQGQQALLRALQALKSQGGVVIEALLPKAADLASEWEIIQGKTIYRGLSYFQTDLQGRYKQNYQLSQSQIWQRISQITDVNHLRNTLEIQKEIINHHISPLYSGPLGIDMLITTDGTLHPCLEINLRMTMGHVALSILHK